MLFPVDFCPPERSAPQKPKAPDGGRPGDDSGPFGKLQPQKSSGRSSRFIPTQPDRVLDAPDLRDDFYLNVLDWGAKSKVRPAAAPPPLQPTFRGH